MRPKRKKAVAPPSPPPVEVPTGDRAALIAAYKAGLITAWKHQGERGYRLTIPDRQDDYVEVAKLGKYLQRLASAS
jgi:hypothetical protein